MTGPYGEAAWSYWASGWRGVLPLPPRRKEWPPRGYTGWAGVTPSGADVQAWCDGPETRGNVALRLPEGVYGLDVDDYGSKEGGFALAALEERLGPLPAAPIVTSRDDGVSGIRLFRAALSEGRRWRDEPAGHGAGIEAIHFGHRYAVVWPSIHPDTGRTYMWNGDGTTPPRLDELPELPPAWVEALSEVGEVASGEMAGHGATVEAVTAMREGEPCDRMREAAARAAARLEGARHDGDALHPAARDSTHELVRLGHEGHAGARKALAEHFGAFVDVRVRRGGDQRSAEAEWWRLTRGAVGKLAGERVAECMCVLPDVGFEWTPPGTGQSLAPSDDQEDGGEGGAGGSDPVALMLAELLTPAQLDALPNPVPLVGGLLDMNTLAWLIGKSGSFKSFVALDIGAHVAAGREWAHRRVRQGPVIYLVAEGGGGMKLRKRAWESLNGPMDESMIRFLVRPVQAKGPEWNVLVALVAHVRPALIIVDTQARVSIGIEENSNTEMSMLVEQIDRLRRVSGACVLMIHHIGRNGEDARGASSLDGAQDTELKAERVGGPKSMTARLVVDKQKDGADTASVDFEMIRVEGGQDPETGRDLSSLALKITSDLFSGPSAAPWTEGLPENQALIVDILIDHFSEAGGSRAEVSAVLKERGQRGEGRYAKSSFHLAWNELLKKGRIERIPGTQRFEAVPPQT